jgi:hypothetical protein
LEFELRSLEHFATKATKLWARVAAWIDEYDRDRRHSALQMRSPISYELYLPAGTEAAWPASDSTACTVLTGVKANTLRVASGQP